jgi:hypothetical protein
MCTYFYSARTYGDRSLHCLDNQKGPDTPDAILQSGAIFRFSLTDNFDPGLSFSNI